MVRLIHYLMEQQLRQQEHMFLILPMQQDVIPPCRESERLVVMLLRDELLRQVETLTAERDRRIDPVEHARAVMNGWIGAVEDRSWWVSSPTRATLLARVGADALAIVEES